ncbi:hypothetical protein [Occallatibacter riparius]|uniref:Haem-binding uptake Tiki superfamily ChaN domain-containing protein n=1 Tax=Occallatibacter riparius TaxID=1002689 RepID=A0A9J7BK57_9BACT|nr:hypothetical protein [Occallatibacter riparius]UWZ82947.1 hypothetical protein MOP44_20540 [Occallatibacter riparius]
MRAALPALLLLLTPLNARPQNHAPTPAEIALDSHTYDLQTNGRIFLLSEAKKNNYFLLGELHGDNEIPALLHTLWPDLWHNGYRYVAAEVSPWTADQLESANPSEHIEGLWTRRQADDLHAIAGPRSHILWGCDMEEIHPEYLIRELARLNPAYPSLQQMDALTKSGYQRSMTAQLLQLAAAPPQHDKTINDISLYKSLLATLQIDSFRSVPTTKMAAQQDREQLMKTQFLAHLRAHAPARVLLRFGRNHLHRGYDARGISTLGNFIAEFALSRGETTFNVGAFGAGGKATLMGETFSMDETADEPTFALLASRAKYAATVFDLRPLRPFLHAIPQEKRTPLESTLIYWSDAYDAIICYKNVTPLSE